MGNINNKTMGTRDAYGRCFKMPRNGTGDSPSRHAEPVANVIGNATSLGKFNPEEHMK